MHLKRYNPAPLWSNGEASRNEVMGDKLDANLGYLYENLIAQASNICFLKKMSEMRSSYN